MNKNKLPLILLGLIFVTVYWAVLLYRYSQNLGVVMLVVFVTMGFVLLVVEWFNSKR